MRGAGARGVTLLEMLIALTVLTLALLAMAGLFPTAYTNVAKGGQQTAAAAVARQMMEMIRGEASFDAVARYAGLDTTTPGTADWLALNGPEHSGAGAPGRLDRWRERVLALPSGRGRVAVIVLAGGVGPNGTPYARVASVTVTVEYREGSAGGRDAVLTTYVAE
ncbi:MAG: prepilin-type N-terminal cleavage/methylation domain-containing protein [candidate division NC10 bacterium]|nr:prepilin-type N-terminal cleavage/methylation domain-containing protein [candidate division NC10 bacterium]MBI3002882.1 prepilin-type N-terminal cleavage/methylation domain-containing protein [candidate division NC10 bacterium]MBI4391148.1 prepilin-type N-terminal cleavage/methylation domain-containing protein [candidate division NC10 bacterium]